MNDTAVCISENKTEKMCSNCSRNIDLADINNHQTFVEFKIKKAYQKNGWGMVCEGKQEKNKGTE
jgi:hypothetical protein